MLHQFLSDHRATLIERCSIKVARRITPEATETEIEHGIPLFLDQLIRTLAVEQGAEPELSRKVSGPAGGIPVLSEISATATQHGREMLAGGYTVDQVVHGYGDLCQSITDLAFEMHAPIGVDEFRTLNRCLDNGIADAVKEFAYQRDFIVAGKGGQALNERLGMLAHELRNLIHTAALAVTAIKAGNVGLSGATGATGAVLDRSLIGLGNLIDRSLADVRVTAGIPPRHALISLARFIAGIRVSAALEAKSKECRFTVAAVDGNLAVDVDRDMLLSAVCNLLQNAFKFTAHRTEVLLTAYAAADRILIEVEDPCGGLPPDAARTMFLPFTQSARTGAVWGWGSRPADAASRPITARSACATGRARAAFLRSICRGMQCLRHM